MRTFIIKYRNNKPPLFQIVKTGEPKLSLNRSIETDKDVSNDSLTDSLGTDQLIEEELAREHETPK